MSTITFDQLHRIAGYIEAGEGDCVSYSQDDATRTWTVVVGNHLRGRRYSGDTLEQAFKVALDDANAYHCANYDLETV